MTKRNAEEKENTLGKIVLSILLFNLVIFVLIYLNDIINAYTITLKIILDVAIGFISDKSIKRLRVSWKDGFVIER